MALTKADKEQIVSELTALLKDSKLTVVANYKGTTVKEIQELRKQARISQTTIKVVKNRLVIQALKGNDRFKDVDVASLNSQLLYAFNPLDEVAPAQVLANFNKKTGKVKFVGAISPEGNFVGVDDVKALASLPSQEQLRAQLVGTISAPISRFVNILSGNIRGVLGVLNAREEILNQ